MIACIGASETGRLMAKDHGAMPKMVISIYATKVPWSHPSLTIIGMEDRRVL